MAFVISPQVDDVVLVVSPVEVDVTGINEQEGEEDEEDLDGVFSSVHKVSIKHVRLFQGGHPVLGDKQKRYRLIDLNIYLFYSI